MGVVNSLIKIEKNNNGDLVVSAKDLHYFLETQTRFDIWIKRMFEYGFTENVDYQCLNKNVQMPQGGIKVVLDDYALTLDCAKEISMLQRTEKGKQCRQYFIQCEKQFKQGAKELSRKEILQIALEAEIQAEKLAKEVMELKPKAEFYDAVMESEDATDLGTASKVLNLGFGRTTLFAKLRDNGILDKKNIPYQRYVDMGYFRVVESSWQSESGETHIYFKTLVLQKGMDFIRKQFLN